MIIDVSIMSIMQYSEGVHVFFLQESTTGHSAKPTHEPRWLGISCHLLAGVAWPTCNFCDNSWDIMLADLAGNVFNQTDAPEKAMKA
jgi:hypothetical protein